MKKERQFYIILSILLIFYVVVEHYQPEPLQWIPTYAPNDKQPYGGYILYDRLEDFFPEGKREVFKTIYEYDSAFNAVILCSDLDMPAEDLTQMIELLNQGSSILIGSVALEQKLLDTLGLEDSPEFDPAAFFVSDSAHINIGQQDFYYPSTMINNHFVLSDSSDWQVLAEFSGNPVMINKDFGKGTLILTTIPLAFSNYGILKGDGYHFAETALNLMRPTSVDYIRYYEVGRGESTSPLRYFVTQPALRWAVYLTLFGVLLVLFINSRRKQRAIPLLAPKTNTTVEYVKTLGGLHYREKNHQKAAQKLINYFLKGLREKYFIKDFGEEMYPKIAVKTGVREQDVVKTFDLINYIKNGGGVSEQTLIELNEKITAFKR